MVLAMMKASGWPLHVAAISIFSDPVGCAMMLLIACGCSTLLSVSMLLFSANGTFWFYAIGALAVSLAYAALRVVPGGRLPAALKMSPANPGCVRGAVAVVTGGNTGIGRCTAQQLAEWGLDVVLGCRDVKKGEQAIEEIKDSLSHHGRQIQGKLVVLPLDLTSMDSVKKFAEQMDKNEFFKIQLLVNNAGIMSLPDLNKVPSVHNLEMQFVTNHVGHFLLTRLLMKKIAACGGRVINLASLAHLGAPKFSRDFYLTATKKTYKPQTFYAMSKQCNIRFTRELNRRFDLLAAEFPDTKAATAYSVHPGVVATELTRYMPEVSAWMRALSKTPMQGAQTSLFLCAADQEDVQPGAYFADCKEAPVAPNSCGSDEDKELWTWSEELLQKHL